MAIMISVRTGLGGMQQRAMAVEDALGFSGGPRSVNDGCVFVWHNRKVRISVRDAFFSFVDIDRITSRRRYFVGER